MTGNHNDIWMTTALLAASTLTIKGIGPFLLGQRDIPALLKPTVLLLPTALMAALVTTALISYTAVAGWTADAAQCAGVLTAGIALLARLPLFCVLGAAVVATASVRLLT